MIHYNKLIRDNVPYIMQRQGKNMKYHEAEADEEYWMLLLRKLQEEIDEFNANQTVEIFGDVLDVLDAIVDFKKFDRKELGAIRENNRETLGGYQKGWVVEESEVEMGQSQEQGI